MGKGTKAVKTLARGSTAHSIGFCSVVSKFQEWDIDKKLSIQRNLQILEIKTTKCCYSPYFHLTQDFLYDITLITTILKIVTRKFSF